MDSCYSTSTCIAIALTAVSAIRLSSNFFVPNHLKTAKERWFLKMLLTNIVGSCVMNIWWPLALTTPTVGGDLIITWFSCNAYYLVCFAWTFYLFDSLDMVLNSKLKFLRVIHHVFVVGLLSVSVWTKALVFLTTLLLIAEINVLHVHSINAFRVYGMSTDNWLYRMMVKAVPPLLLAIRLPLFFLVQWQLLAHWGDESMPKWGMITIATCMFGMLVQNLFRLEQMKNNKFGAQWG